MRRITQIISAFRQRPLIFLVEEVRLRTYIVGLVVVILLFGVFYTCLTPKEHGIGENGEPLSDVTIFTGIYFSVVTISSLGYGHMHPMGLSKVFACAEVLIGLAIIGIMIAKVTSQRLSHHVSHLFASDAQKRLEDIASKFETFQLDFWEIIPKLEGAYQNVPGQMSPFTEDRSTLILNLREAISDLQSECVKLHDYFLFESKQDNYFCSAPVGSVARVGNAVDSAFLALGKLIISVPIQATREMLDNHNRQMIFEAIESQKKVCRLVSQYATDSDTLSVFQRIEETCKQVPASYLAVPEKSQPDQILTGTNEPQELLKEDNE